MVILLVGQEQCLRNDTLLVNSVIGVGLRMLFCFVSPVWSSGRGACLVRRVRRVGVSGAASACLVRASGVSACLGRAVRALSGVRRVGVSGAAVRVLSGVSASCWRLVWRVGVSGVSACLGPRISKAEDVSRPQLAGSDGLIRIGRLPTSRHSYFGTLAEHTRCSSWSHRRHSPSDLGQCCSEKVGSL